MPENLSKGSPNTTHAPHANGAISGAGDRDKSVDLLSFSRRMSLEFAAVFLSSGLVFLLFQSHNLTAVDGAVRAFDVFREPRVMFHPNNHMLYPVHVLVWTRILAKMGFSLTAPTGFIRVVQAMNAAFAAGCCSILFTIVRNLTGSLKLGLLATLSWSLSHAVLLHATNAAEPMSGLFFSVCALAVTIVSVRRGAASFLILAGFLLALAMASYQSMVFLGPACGLVAVLWPVEDRRINISTSVQRGALVMLSFVGSIALIYGMSYWHQGVRTISQAIQMFVTVGASNVYGGFRITRFLHLPIGLANAIVTALPSDYAGLRSIARMQRSWLFWTPIIVVATSAVVLWSLCRKRSRSAPTWLRPFVIACWSSLAVGFLLLAYWNPLYDKLWLQPLWLISLLVFTHAKFLSPPRRSVQLPIIVLALSCAIVNITMAYNASHGSWQNLQDARRISRMLKPNDFTVTDWSSVAVLYRQVWAGDSGSLDFVTLTCGNADSGLKVMQTRIESVKAHGGEVYFLGPLDLNKPVWDGFLAARCGVPYESLSRYREQSRVIETFESDGQQISLQRFGEISPN
jgi:hypothetical protein